MKKLLISLATSVAAIAVANPAYSQTFVNGGFEDGTINGWTTGGGTWTGGPYPVASDYLPGGSRYDASQSVVVTTTPGFDAYTDNNLRTVYAGNYSAMVNNPVNNDSVSVISQRVNGYTDSQIAFAYAAVLQDSHGPTDSDAFIITLTDATTNEVLFTYNLNSATAASGTFTQSNSGWYYTDWLTQSIDVSSRVGHDFILSLLANDCPYGGHAGYAYLDGFGGVIPIPGGTPPRAYWDGDSAGHGADGVVQGGNGVWTSDRSTFTGANGIPDNSQPQGAEIVFAGSPGTVVVDNSMGQVKVAGLDFQVGGYIINGNTATDGLELTGSSVKFNVGDESTAAPNMVATVNTPLAGTAAVEKTGAGTLILGGTSTMTGPTTVSAGTLAVNGSIAGSAVTVGTGATLKGSGTVGATDVQTGGTIAPGNSIGTLNVAGNYNQAAGATYQVELNTTSSDRIIATGAATVATGAVVNVTRTAPTRVLVGSKYAIITAAGGVTGKVTLTGDLRVSAFSNLVDTYDATNVYLSALQTRRFAAAGLTPNQIASAGGSDIGSGPIWTPIVNLQTDAEARAAFDATSGELHATVRGQAFEDSRFVREAMLGHLQQAGTDAPPEPVWGHAFGSWGNAQTNFNAAASTRDIGGIFLGYDVVHGDAFRLGLMGGYANSTLRVADRVSNASADDINLGVYGGYGDGKFSASLGGGYTWRDIKANRVASFTGFTDSLASNYKVKVAQVFGELAYRWQLPTGGGLGPFVNVAYVNVDGDAAGERGGAAALSLRSGKQDWVVGTAGIRVDAKIGSAVRLKGDVGYRLASKTLPAASLSFAGGSLFTVTGTPIASDQLSLDLGLDAKLASRLTFGLSYSGRHGGGRTDNGGKASLRFSF
ncbi:autotransporter outer membrane beta-barrel domain-containing protein [Sphingomonas immobilis]|uniref:Autotransporter domain-containing protein n=1 Tax=Sphingomonas immobilis TaxID=3063997 RepID=A0ABT8ZWP6_9SPHN|nr:autotransporter domain-containing protein [Sphingomonas sp. CA1-15]MDO7842007.1 autotransporter domain-containing protein [Sphingomonas sp. CA1-15]